MQNEFDLIECTNPVSDLMYCLLFQLKGLPADKVEEEVKSMVVALKLEDKLKAQVSLHLI